MFFGMVLTGGVCSTSFWQVHQVSDWRVDMTSRGPLLTQLELGSRKRHHTPSALTSSMRLHLLRKTASMRFLRSMICWSCLALVGAAA